MNAYDAVYAPIDGSANAGMDILADIDGTSHFEGYSYWDENAQAFRLLGDDNSSTGAFGLWSGGFGLWSGAFGLWSGGFGLWSGGFGYGQVISVSGQAVSVFGPEGSVSGRAGMATGPKEQQPGTVTNHGQGQNIPPLLLLKNILAVNLL